MSVTTQNNILDVFVAKNTAPTGGTSMTSDLAASMAEGQIVVTGFDIANNVEKALNLISATPSISNTPYIRFVQKINGELYYGSKIYGKDIVSVKARAKSDFKDQVWSVGFNGSANSLDTAAGNEFMITIAYDHDDIMWSEQKLRNTYDYYSASPTQKGLATSMTSQINKKEYLGLLNGTGRMVSAMMLGQGSAASPTTATTIAVKPGSDVITLSAADTSVQTIGTVVRLGSSGSGRTNTVPVYTIVGIPSTDSTLGAAQARIHTPYQGTVSTSTGAVTDSAATLDATADAGVVATVTNYGFHIVGLPLTWKKDFFKYNKVKFHFDLKGFGDTVVSKTVESTKGIGYYQEVAELESFAAGNQGALNRTVVPLPTGRIMTDVNTAAAASGYTYYNVWHIESRDTANYSPIVASTPMRIQTMLFFPDSATTGDLTQQYMLDVNAVQLGQNLTNWFSTAGFTVAAV